VELQPDDARAIGRLIVPLDALGNDPTVNLNIADVTKAFGEQLSPRLTDLLELAAYVFSADSSARRGTKWSNEGTTENYDRDFHLIMPVREVQFWQNADVHRQLISILNFLTDDRWQVDFVPLQAKRSIQGYFNTARTDWPFNEVERVIMFSGGLDSLAGAIETGKAGGKLVLVSHRSKGMMNERQQYLVAELARMFPGRILHVPVWINKDSRLGKEYTQRSRSFLFASLGVVVAASVKAKGVRFFENGVVSINLPVAEEVKRSRASRTTHPLGLMQFERFFKHVLDRSIEFDNPFIERTKEEVVASVASHGAAGLISRTCSCAHTGHFQAKAQQHCGTCSQCIDRRVAILAAGLEREDPETDYVSDVFAGPRRDGYEQNMGVDFVHHALSLYRMSDDEIATKFNMELSRAARPFPDRPAAIKSFVDLHRRHAAATYRVLVQEIQKVGGKQVTGELEPTSLLAKVALSEHLKAPWRRYAERLVAVLEAGLPIACKSQKPANEPRLQEVCDSLLVAAGENLVREFPFVRWSSSMTKPDWSNEGMNVWVELKFVRKRTDIKTITEAMAADVTKYGDNGRRTLFVVYDPTHLIADERSFSREIGERQDMMLRVVR
jgi:hypothetical protein